MIWNFCSKNRFCHFAFPFKIISPPVISPKYCSLPLVQMVIKYHHRSHNPRFVTGRRYPVFIQKFFRHRQNGVMITRRDAINRVSTNATNRLCMGNIRCTTFKRCTISTPYNCEHTTYRNLQRDRNLVRLGDIELLTF